MFKAGFIDYYLDEWHAQNYPKWIEDISGGRFKVTAAYGDVEGNLFGRRSNQDFCDAYGIELMPTIEALIDAVDCLIVLSPDNPEEHMRLADLALRSGKPVYVDKTFANSEADANSLFDLAEGTRTPMYSTSALRYSKAYLNLPADICNLRSQGGGTPYNYLVHQLEPIIKMMGTDVKRAMAWGTDKLATYLLEFESGKVASLNQHESFAFQMQIEADKETFTVEANDDFFNGMISDMLAFFSRVLENGDRTTPVPREETVAIMAAREILLEALANPGNWINRKR